MKDNILKSATNGLPAIIAAFLFGVSPVLVKYWSGPMQPFLLAGLLYLGSGIALSLPLIKEFQKFKSEIATLTLNHKLRLLAAIVSGGVLAPIFLAYGLRYGTAFEVSLLLNLETVFSTVLAFLIFKEHVGKEVWIGKILLVIAGVMVAYNPMAESKVSLSGIFIILACFFWGLDNNFTRDVESLSANYFASLKGLTSGVFNIVLFFIIGSFASENIHSVNSFLTIKNIFLTLMIGAFCYGVSLIYFIISLRQIGTSRTSTYFATGPFIGMFMAIALLHEKPTVLQWGATALMILGVGFLVYESHSHFHFHEEIEHEHEHSHDEINLDEHHLHEHHEGGASLDKKYRHTHLHLHKTIRHSHKHFPDIHHRHPH